MGGSVAGPSSGQPWVLGGPSADPVRRLCAAAPVGGTCGGFLCDEMGLGKTLQASAAQENGIHNAFVGLGVHAAAKLAHCCQLNIAPASHTSAVLPSTRNCT